MAMVRVVNENIYPFSQSFKGQMISLGAKDDGKNYIDMERDDAIQFLGQYSPMEVDVDGNPHPRGKKMLRITAVPGVKQTKAEPELDKFVCNSCRFEARSQNELDAHIDEKHLDEIADEDEREKRLERRRGGSQRKK